MCKPVGACPLHLTSPSSVLPMSRYSLDLNRGMAILLCVQIGPLHGNMCSQGQCPVTRALTILGLSRSPLCGPQVNGATLVHLITGVLWGLNLTEEPGRGEVGMNSHFMRTQAFFHPLLVRNTQEGWLVAAAVHAAHL